MARFEVEKITDERGGYKLFDTLDREWLRPRFVHERDALALVEALDAVETIVSTGCDRMDMNTSCLWPDNIELPDRFRVRLPCGVEYEGDGWPDGSGPYTESEG